MSLERQQSRQLAELGRRVRNLRLAGGLTQQKLAEKSDLALRNVQRIEAGQLNLLYTTLIRLREALGASWDELLGSGKR